MNVESWLLTHIQTWFLHLKSERQIGGTLLLNVSRCCDADIITEDMIVDSGFLLMTSLGMDLMMKMLTLSPVTTAIIIFIDFFSADH